MVARHIFLKGTVPSHGTVKIAALRRFFFVLKGTTFRCYILEPVPDVPLVRLWGSIGTRIPIWAWSAKAELFPILGNTPFRPEKYPVLLKWAS